ncbi:MAG: hypothetical protein LAT79_01175 [Kiritimatiellae bacterium]|nr:hypothetical protein [Kiritimatiellia bacterium]
MNFISPSIRALTSALLFFISFTVAPAAAADGTAAGHAADSPMARVAGELDLGGPVFQLTDGTYQWEAVSWIFEIFPGMISMMAAMDTTGAFPPNLTEAMDNLPAFLGLNQILANGVSTRALPGGGYLTRNVQLLQPDAGGLIWSLHGKPFQLQDEIRKLPPTTAAMMRIGFNAPTAVRRGLQLSREMGVPPEAMAEVTTLLSENRELAGDIMTALNEGITLGVTLNPENQWPLPLPGMEPVSEPGLIVRIPDAEARLFSLILARIQEDAPFPVQTMEIQGAEVQTLPLPVPAPTPQILTLAHMDGHVAITTSPELMEALMTSLAGEGDRPLLARLPEGTPDEAVGAWISTREFQDLLTNLMSASLHMSTAMAGDMPMGINPMTMLQGWTTFITDMYNTNIILEARGDFRQTVLMHARPMLTGGNNQAMMMTAPMTTGMLAAIALPSFSRARQSAQRNACINNLRIIDSAKDQWAIETNRRSGDPVTREDLLKYFHDRQLPVCPAGGAYELGTIGESPRCSLGETLDHTMPAW